mgnify:CR=1 FL=1
MRKIHWVAFSLLGAACAVNVFAGCGSDVNVDSGADASDDGSNSDGGDLDGGANDGFIDAITIDGSIDAADCKLVGQGCGASSDCCSANCGTDGGTAGTCDPPNSACKLPGVVCSAGTECCTGSCTSGTCSNKQCVPDKPTAGSCFRNEDCCSGICAPDGTGGGKCASVNPGSTCRTAGNPCSATGDCCSNFCNGGLCSDGVSFCTQKSEICAFNSECCSGNCVKTGANTTGTCGVPLGGGASNCSPTGTVCQTGTATDAGSLCEQSCCSRSCGPYGGANGFKVCQPPSGCRPTGEVCRTNSDCCGAAGSPAPTGGSPNTCEKPVGAAFGRCNNGGSCREPGSICKAGGFDSCSAENNCCESFNQPSGNCNNTPENCCKQDALGIPRCLVAYLNCDAGLPDAGSSCATSADCCGNPCINHQCAGTACIPSGGTCTTNADCCAGVPCAVPAGSTAGICGGTIGQDGGVIPPSDGGVDAGDAGSCALYGQQCVTGADCCNGVPCTSNRCRFP